jgi:hypothetical protein
MQPRDPVPHRTAALLLLLGALAPAAPAGALTRRELACQVAIARAGREYVTRTLAQRARCQIDAVQGKTCDDDAATERNEARVRRRLRRCRGVALARLGGGGGCLAQSADTDGLVDCVLAIHDDAVAILIDAQFGLGALTPGAVATPCGLRCPLPAASPSPRR